MPLSTEVIAALVSIPAALGVIVTVGLFLRHISEQRKEDRDWRVSERMVWENHLSGSIAVQRITTEILTSLRDEIRELRRERQ